jgi:hypothetical protein|tara:strand:- start:139 stop:513 length:375 start_codon:yes stop_codon:yes gene_type:complete
MFESLEYSKNSQKSSMSVTSQIIKKLNDDILEIQKGLQPDQLSFWYQKLISDTKEMAPPWLQDKIKVKQDPILPMKFNVDISKRAVRYLMICIDNNLQQMPYTTQLYFLKVQEIMSLEMDKALI